MMKTLITVAGVAGTLGVAAPAFADWYEPAPAPVYAPPVQQPVYGYGYGNEYGYGDRDRDDWWRRREEWRRHEAWERYHRWHHWEHERHEHEHGWGW